MTINIFSLRSLMIAFSATLLFASCKKDSDPIPEPNTVVNVLVNNGYSTLATLATNANLVTTLNGDGPFTVFAPGNDAFTGVTAPTGQALSSLLTYHVIGGQSLSAQQVIALSNGNLVKVIMANGDSTFVKASAAGVFVNGVQVTTPNLTGTNGIVHGMGRILFPPTGDIVATAIATPGFDSLVKAVVRVSAPGTPAAQNIASILSTANGLTVFAPTNQAFAALFANAAFPFRQINDIPVDVLRTVLLHHVVPARAFSNDLANGNLGMANTSNATVAGVGTANITIRGSGTVFNNAAAPISATNIMARNGVIHVIGGVIIP